MASSVSGAGLSVEISCSSSASGLSLSSASSSSSAGSCLRGRWATTSMCRSSKARLACTHRRLGSGGSISECSPQPWSSETTRPSSGLHLFAHTPNKRSSSPLSGTKKPQVEHRLPSAVLVLSAFGPRGPSYQRLAACARPNELNTWRRVRRNTSTASLTSCRDDSWTSPSSIRSSSGLVPMESVGDRSVGSRRSFHGIHLGGINASSAGIREDSFTVHESNSSS